MFFFFFKVSGPVVVCPAVCLSARLAVLSGRPGCLPTPVALKPSCSFLAADPAPAGRVDRRRLRRPAAAVAAAGPSFAVHAPVLACRVVCLVLPPPQRALVRARPGRPPCWNQREEKRLPAAGSRAAKSGAQTCVHLLAHPCGDPDPKDFWRTSLSDGGLIGRLVLSCLFAFALPAFALPRI